MIRTVAGRAIMCWHEQAFPPVTARLGLQWIKSDWSASAASLKNLSVGALPGVCEGVRGRGGALRSAGGVVPAPGHGAHRQQRVCGQRPAKCVTPACSCACSALHTGHYLKIGRILHVVGVHFCGGADGKMHALAFESRYTGHARALAWPDMNTLSRDLQSIVKQEKV